MFTPRHKRHPILDRIRSQLTIAELVAASVLCSVGLTRAQVSLVTHEIDLSNGICDCEITPELRNRLIALNGFSGFSMDLTFGADFGETVHIVLRHPRARDFEIRILDLDQNPQKIVHEDFSYKTRSIYMETVQSSAEAGLYTIEISDSNPQLESYSPLEIGIFTPWFEQSPNGAINSASLTPETASWLKKGLHTINPRTTEQWFRFIGNESDRVNVQISAALDEGNGGGINFAIYNKFRTQVANARLNLASLQENEFFEDKERAFASYQIPDTDLYYLRIWFNDNTSGKYQISPHRTRSPLVNKNMIDLDADQDGLSIDREYYFGTSPNSADTDRDGLGDYQEIIHKSDPLIDESEIFRPTDNVNRPYNKQNRLHIVKRLNRFFTFQDINLPISLTLTNLAAGSLYQFVLLPKPNLTTPLIATLQDSNTSLVFESDNPCFGSPQFLTTQVSSNLPKLVIDREGESLMSGVYQLGIFEIPERLALTSSTGVFFATPETAESFTNEFHFGTVNPRFTSHYYRILPDDPEKVVTGLLSFSMSNGPIWLRAYRESGDRSERTLLDEEFSYDASKASPKRVGTLSLSGTPNTIDEQILFEVSWQTKDGEACQPASGSFTLQVNNASKNIIRQGSITIKAIDEDGEEIDFENIYLDDNREMPITNAEIGPFDYGTEIVLEDTGQPRKDNYEFVSWIQADRSTTIDSDNSAKITVPVDHENIEVLMQHRRRGDQIHIEFEQQEGGYQFGEKDRTQSPVIRLWGRGETRKFFVDTIPLGTRPATRATTSFLRSRSADFRLETTEFSETLDGDSKSIPIPITIFDDVISEGTERFQLIVRSPGIPNAVVEVGIEDDEGQATFDHSFIPPKVLYPETRDLAIHLLVQDPDGHNGEFERGAWKLPWEIAWHESGHTIRNLEAGVYAIDFLPVGGFETPSLTVDTRSSNMSVQEYNGLYHRSAGSSASEVSLKFELDDSLQIAPDLRNTLKWIIDGDEDNAIPFGTQISLQPGHHIVTFTAGTDFLTPPPLVLDLDSNFSGNVIYESVPETSTIQSPRRLEFEEFEKGFMAPPFRPYGFNGQIRTSSGAWGSGFMVHKRVIITAAHNLVLDGRMDDGTTGELKRAEYVEWFGRRHSQEFEPMPIPVRSSDFIVMSGYDERRLEDLRNGTNPGEAGLLSQEFDVAAIYFKKDLIKDVNVGYSLPNDDENVDTLEREDLLFISYPSHNTLASEPPIAFGTPYFSEHPSKPSAEPAPDFDFSEIIGTSGLNIRTSAFIGHKGSSGGSLNIKRETSTIGEPAYYPVGVYLSNTSNDQEAVFRLFDERVVHMIQEAITASTRGENNLGDPYTRVKGVSGITRSADHNVTVFLRAHPGQEPGKIHIFQETDTGWVSRGRFANLETTPLSTSQGWRLEFESAEIQTAGGQTSNAFRAPDPLEFGPGKEMQIMQDLEIEAEFVPIVRFGPLSLNENSDLQAIIEGPKGTLLSVQQSTTLEEGNWKDLRKITLMESPYILENLQQHALEQLEPGDANALFYRIELD